MFIASVCLLFIVFSCSDKGQSGPRPPVGGECEYKHYKGTAEIVSIAERPNAPKKYEVKFTFHPEEPVKEEFAKTEGKEYLLLLNNSSYPGADFISTYGIAVGTQLDCYMKVITKGTCTPILFEFPTIDR